MDEKNIVSSCYCCTDCWTWRIDTAEGDWASDVLDGDSQTWGIGMANMLIREMRGLRGSVPLVGIRVGDP